MVNVLKANINLLWFGKIILVSKNWKSEKNELCCFVPRAHVMAGKLANVLGLRAARHGGPKSMNIDLKYCIECSNNTFARAAFEVRKSLPIARYPHRGVDL
ncbi:hypothetical protein [Cognatiyoonia sp. IB215182]|uniref:hypothetical protein n=1 Tax=Cognatiyoonia sp. IB215182 TaxID=3097353 RepID=UPI002A0D0EBC|nr:hypothetical protein [Cognatiyoonia sp. IB215182]MDX8353172.1 hypothetical protein [Cognatiyoonia sp. IB215182]